MNYFSSTYLRLWMRIKSKQIWSVLPFYKHDNYPIFLLLSHPRTGSSLLHTYLNSHSQILSLNEPLSHTSKQSVLLKPYSKKIKAVGFKFFYEYIAEEEKKTLFINLLQKPRIHIIKIRRRNMLRVYVSLKIAQSTNEWSRVKSVNQPIHIKKVSLSKKECVEAFHCFEDLETKTESILKEFKIPVFQVDYETLVLEPNETLFNIQKFLGVGMQKPVTFLKRQNAENLEELIENYEALKESFIGTEYQHFFND